jgi:hypothetical protein
MLSSNPLCRNVASAKPVKNTDKPIVVNPEQYEHPIGPEKPKE